LLFVFVSFPDQTEWIGESEALARMNARALVGDVWVVVGSALSTISKILKTFACTHFILMLVTLT
jgi:hypothetical protein